MSISLIQGEMLKCVDVNLRQEVFAIGSKEAFTLAECTKTNRTEH